MWDFAPVGPDELWIVGNPSTLHRQDSMLAHFQHGQWTTMSAPDHVLLGTLHMPSAAAGYAIGWQPEPKGGHRISGQPHVVLQYDGSAWYPIETGADPQAQHIVIVDDSDLWAFVRTPSYVPGRRANDVVSTVQRTVGMSENQWQWQAVDWPFSDIIGVRPLARAAPGEYWAGAQYVMPPERAEDFHWGLLHFIDGTWQEYLPG